ncbi:MAG: hypothetical protein U0074_05535 [Kouleothrix sp.]
MPKYRRYFIVNSVNKTRILLSKSTIASAGIVLAWRSRQAAVSWAYAPAGRSSQNMQNAAARQNSRFNGFSFDANAGAGRKAEEVGRLIVYHILSTYRKL